MGHVDPGSYGSPKGPTLTVEVLKGADIAVLTVRETNMGIVTSIGKSAMLKFREFPEYAFWLNKKSVQNLCDALGTDDNDWVGQRVALVKVRNTNPRDGSIVTKYEVAPANEWQEIFRAARSGSARKTPTPQRTAKPRAARKPVAKKAKKK